MRAHGALNLIASGAYVDQELTAEFGALPPSFLPLGVSRLYEHQRSLFADDAAVVLSLPESFLAPPLDEERLAQLGVEIVRTPDGLRLGDSILYVINTVCEEPIPVRLLHGDTLLHQLPAAGGDVVAVGADSDDYAWAEVALEGDVVVDVMSERSGGQTRRRHVAAGFFQFGSSAELARALTEARGDFIEGLKRYGRRRRLRATPAEGWSDFGHIQTYFRSRRRVGTARAFNTLTFEGDLVRKSSADTVKMRAEANWLLTCPPSVRLHAVRLIEDATTLQTAPGYAVEYRHAPTLAELNVFSHLGRASWRRILNACQDFLSACVDVQGEGSADAALAALAGEKTIARLETFARETGFAIDAPLRMGGRAYPSLLSVAERLNKILDLETGRRETVMHGDFCFSNILYDSRAGRISVIDPRGFVTPGHASLFGDPRYDMAKLRHSVFGRYDHILAGRYRLVADGGDHPEIMFEPAPQQAWLEGAVNAMAVGEVRADDVSVQAAAAGLFLSMLPLHADRPDRQSAFVANALRLFRELEASAA